MSNDQAWQLHWFQTQEENAATEALITEMAERALEVERTVVDEHREALRHIAGDGDLSPAGKASRRADLAQRSTERLEKTLGMDLKKLDERIEAEEGRLVPQRPDTDPMLEQLKQQEARTMLKEEYPTELELHAAYTAWASEGGKDHLMRAVEESPMRRTRPLTSISSMA